MRIKFQILILLFFVGIILICKPIQAPETSFNLSEDVIKQAKDIAAKEFSHDLSKRRPEGLSKLDTDEEIRKVIEESMKELGDDNRDVQSKGLRKLRYLGKLAFADIVKGLESENKNVRQWCVSLLGYRGEDAVPYLSKALRSDSEKLIRSSAASYLGQTYNPNAVPALLDALDDKNYSVSISAVHALAFIKDKRSFSPLKKLVEDTAVNGQVRHAAADTIFRIDKEEASKVIRDVIAKESNEYVRHNFNAVLQSDGEYPYWPSDYLGLYQLKNDADTLAGESFSEKEIQELLENLDSSYGLVASGCLYTLASLKASEAVPEIIAKGRKGSGLYSCLAKIGSPEAVDYLIECIKSKDQNLRVSAIGGLGYAGRWAVSILIELLDDKSLRTTHKGDIEPIDAFNGIWPDSHTAYIDLSLCLSNNGLKRTLINLASGAEFNIDEEIRRVKDWWNNYGEDFLQGKIVPNPSLKMVFLET